MKLKTKATLFVAAYLLTPMGVFMCLIIWPSLKDGISEGLALGAGISWFLLFAISQVFIIRCPQPYCGRCPFFTSAGRITLVVGNYCPHCGQAFDDEAGRHA